MTRSDFRDCSEGTRQAYLMNDEYSRRSRRDRALDAVWINVESQRVDVNKDRFGASRNFDFLPALYTRLRGFRGLLLLDRGRRGNLNLRLFVSTAAEQGCSKQKR